MFECQLIQGGLDAPPFFVSRNPKTHKRHKKSTKPKHDKALRLCVDTQENTKGTKTDRQPIEFVCFVCFVFLAHNPKPAPLLALNRICVFCVFSGFKQSTAAKFIKHHSFLWLAKSAILASHYALSV